MDPSLIATGSLINRIKETDIVNFNCALIVQLECDGKGKINGGRIGKDFYRAGLGLNGRKLGNEEDQTGDNEKAFLFHATPFVRLIVISIGDIITVYPWMDICGA